jgi:predicted RND superfamily exporter protein
MIDKLSRFVAAHPWPFVIGFVVVALGMGSRIPTAQVDPEVKNQLPKDFPARVDLDKIEERFGGTEMVMLTLVGDDVLAPDTLRRIRKLSDGLKRMPQVDRVLSLFELKDIKNEGATMVVDPAVKRIPETEAQREALRADLKENDLIYGSVVSEDFKATAIIGLLSITAKDQQTVPGVQKLIESVPGPEEVHVAGFPLVRVLMEKNIQHDLRMFLPLGLLIMLVFLFICFRQLRGVLLPFFVVVMSVQVAMGLIPLLGWKIQMITVSLPVILLAIANDYGIHIIARYQEANTPGSTLTKRDLAENVLRELARPIFIAGLTTIAGMMCLMLHIIVPAMQLGILASVGIGFALLASLLFIPAVLALVRKAKPMVTAAEGREGQSESAGKMALLDRMLARVARGVSARPKAILIGFVGVVALVAFGITRVEVDTNTINYFPDGHPLVESSRVADEHFGGSVTFSVSIEGDVKHPELLRKLDDLEKKLLALPEVDQVSSIAKVIRRMNKVMNEGDAKHDRIPDTRDTVAQLLLMYENGGDPDDFDRLVDFDYRHALLTARINTPSTKSGSKVIRFVRNYVKTSNMNAKVTQQAQQAAAGQVGGGGAKRGVPSRSHPTEKVTRTEPATRPASRPASMPASRPASQPAEEDSPFTLVDGEGAEKQTDKEEETEDSPFTLVDEGGKEKEEKKAAASASSKKQAPPSPRFSLIGGFGVMFNDLVDAIITGQLQSLFLSLLLVAIIVAVLFRSVVAGLLSGGTLGLAMAFLFGLMGLLGIELNLPTAMLSSIMIGVGVDYTIHFLWRYREERRGGREPADAVFRTLTTSGRGIIINALSVVVGFAVMLVSSFVPVRYFGFLVVVSISACLVGAMVLIPAIVLLFRPRFLEPKTQ